MPNNSTRLFRENDSFYIFCTYTHLRTYVYNVLSPFSYKNEEIHYIKIMSLNIRNDICLNGEQLPENKLLYV